MSEVLLSEEICARISNIIKGMMVYVVVIYFISILNQRGNLGFACIKSNFLILSISTLMANLIGYFFWMYELKLKDKTEMTNEVDLSFHEDDEITF